jgi:energy-coupling factor transport system permease protein
VSDRAIARVGVLARPTASVHPAAWLAWSVGAGAFVLATSDPVLLAVVVASAWFVATVRGRRDATGVPFRGFLMAAVAALVLRTALVALGTIDASSIAFAALEGLRLAALLVVVGAFNAVADPFGILRLAPRRFHEPALAAALALSIAPRTALAARRVHEAQRARGLRLGPLRALPALAIPVLATGMEEALSLAESMDARGHGRGRRTRYRPQPWTPEATLTVVTAAVAAGVVGWAALGGWAELHPSTAPLGWPATDPRLVLAAFALAVPGLDRSR